LVANKEIRMIIAQKREDEYSKNCCI